MAAQNRPVDARGAEIGAHKPLLTNPAPGFELRAPILLRFRGYEDKIVAIELENG
ncbi:hypothetical protein SAMN05877809_11614 [Rhodobacter sp. JA431]|nr:hypothetical protein SAMN05877809_11614 [Rhodobacter sp. JA431]